jgi:hypothetical protein
VFLLRFALRSLLPLDMLRRKLAQRGAQSLRQRGVFRKHNAQVLLALFS